METGAAMLVAFFAVISPLLILLGIGLRWLMPKSLLFARPEKPFQARIWQLMVLTVIIACDYWMVNPNLSSSAPRMNSILFAYDFVFFLGLLLLVRGRRLSSIGWLGATWLVSFTLFAFMIAHRILFPPH